MPHISWSKHAVAALLGLAVAACGEAGESSTVTVSDSAGIAVLTSGGPGWGHTPDWALELDLEIGDVEGPNAFGRLADVVPRRSGGMWVADAQSYRIRGYHDDGTEVASFGKPGQGPGEFRSVGRIAEVAGGSVAVGGRMPLELYRFDADGRPLGTETVEAGLYREPTDPDAPERPPVGPTLGQWGFGPDGSPFLQTVTLDAPAGELVRSDVLVRMETGDRPAVRFASWETPAMVGGPDGAPILLQATASWSPLSDGGVWFAAGDEYELRRYGPAGEVQTILRRRVARTRLTEDLKARLVADLAEGAENPSTLAMLDRAVFPEFLPAISKLWVSDSGSTLWVGVMDPTLPWRLDEPNGWDIFTFDGTFLGRLPMPPGLRPTHVTDTHVYGIWKDDLDVAHARRYRIIRSD